MQEALLVLQKCPGQLRCVLRSENSLTKPKVNILVSESPKPSEAIGGLECGSTSPFSAVGAAQTQGGCLGAFCRQVAEKAGFPEEV